MRIEQRPEFQIHLQNLKSKEQLYLETIFSVANGHIGVRDSNPLQGNNPNYMGTPGLFINGFYDYYQIQYGEKYTGYPVNDQVINRLCDPRYIQIKIGEEDSAVDYFKVETVDKNLDMQTGLLHEIYSVTTPQGKIFNLIVESFASVESVNVYGIKYGVVPINFDDEVEIIKVHSYINQATSATVSDVRVNEAQGHLQLDFLDGYEQPSYLVTTYKSQQGSLVTFNGDGPKLSYFKDESNHWGYHAKYQAKKGTQKEFEFLFSIGDVYPLVNARMYADQYLVKLNEDIKNTSFKSELMASAQVWQTFWLHSDVEIDGDPQVQLSLRFNFFELYQSAGKDSHTSIPAKGLSGSGYGGHYFWDTEIFMLPFFIYTNPELAKKILMYRYETLKNSQQQATQFGFKGGAMYAWRTINGYEASAYWPAGTAQIHINADIAYAIEQYYEVTKDDDFLNDYGYEIIVETARFYMEWGNFAEIDGKRRFVINRVTGPDEYSAVVDNNYFTNKMVKFNFRMVQKYAKRFEHTDLSNRLGLSPEELERIQEAADSMYLPFDEDNKIKLQYQNFDQMNKIDLAKIDNNDFPLLLHYHPLMLYRSQVNKQADTILADVLFPQGYSDDELKRDFDFYEPITTHDSSLSQAVFAIAAARVGKNAQSYSFFTQAIETDIQNSHHNTANGIHAGSLGAAWEGVFYGFAGVVNNAEIFSMDPKLPAQWNSVKFRIFLYGSEYIFAIYEHEVHVSLLSGKGSTIKIAGAKCELDSESPDQVIKY
ncbi:glycoside hydrolase family 65 protein [Lentilactobacillus kosonis]|uniref:Maltose phosphorylase n=1 Tax=Lentilactobacillus kosonis TaxID=2810561 RepID=A0A401FIT2_9LACO|nr:glycosyl hydrolase family 65 protein [Lentilactobacillus kosonis]GAY72161.1 maltose phosphorylase [Lentilactobacillus kosonis]